MKPLDIYALQEAEHHSDIELEDEENDDDMVQERNYD
jgi:hypothetical protein